MVSYTDASRTLTVGLGVFKSQTPQTGPDWSGRGTYGPQYRPTSDLLFNVVLGNGVPAIGDEQRANLAADAKYWNLAAIVQGLQAKGLRPVTLSELLASAHTVRADAE